MPSKPKKTAHCPPKPPTSAEIKRWLNLRFGENGSDSFIVNEPTAITFPAVVQSPPDRPKTTNNEPSLTSQEFASKCDINMIVARWRKSGQIDHLAKSVAKYGDFSNATDYATALETVESALDRFDELPSSMRAACDNDPEIFLQHTVTAEGRQMLQNALQSEAEPTPVVQTTDPKNAPENPSSEPSGPSPDKDGS